MINQPLIPSESEERGQKLCSLLLDATDKVANQFEVRITTTEMLTALLTIVVRVSVAMGVDERTFSAVCRETLMHYKQMALAIKQEKKK